MHIRKLCTRFRNEGNVQKKIWSSHDEQKCCGNSGKKKLRRNNYVRGKNKASFNQLPSKMYSKRKLAVKNETNQEDINRKLRLFPCRKH